MKRFISHLVTAAMLLATTLTTHAAEKPDIVHYTAQFLDRVLHVTLQWQSANPVTLVRVSAGQQAKEVKVDEYDNRRVPGGYTGEVTVNVPVDAALYQTAVPYVLQLQDELRLKSELVTGNAPMPAAAGYDGYDRGYGDHGGRRDDRWGQDALKDRPKSEGGSGSIIDKLAELKDKYDLAPSITEIKVNQVGPENVTFTLKANDDKQLREINFKVFDAAGNLAQTQQVTGLGRVWEGTSPVFKLSGGSYKVTAQAIDSAGNTSKEQTATFFVKGTAPEPPPPPLPAGECGPAHGKSFDTRPTTDLCKQGTATDVLGDGPWTWSCKGLNGGDSSCKADKTTTPVPKTHEVKAVASQGGSVTPASQNIEHGTKAIVTVTSEEGFKIKSVTGCGEGRLEGDKYTTAPVIAPCEVKAEFEKQEFEVTTSSNCATITPASRKVLYGDTTTFKIVPNVGKKLSSVSGCNIVKMTEETYTTGTIAAACSVQAVCDAVLHEVKAVASQGGGATPPSQNIEHGTKAIVTVTSDKGFKIKSVTGCGEGRLEGDKYTTAPVIAPCEVKAEFEKQEFEVTTSSNCATITPASRKVLYGDTITFKIVPNAGKKLSSVSGCNIVKMTEETYTTGTITAACSVQAVCDAVLHEVKAVASQGGSVTPASQNIEHGTKAIVTVTSDKGFKIKSVTGCGGSSPEGNKYTTAPVTAPCEVKAEFEKLEFEVTASSNCATVTPTNRKVRYKDTTTFKIVPNTGKKLSSVSGCDGGLTGDTYTTGAITSDCSVQAVCDAVLHEVKAVASQGCSAVPASQNVEHGKMATISITSTGGYKPRTITGCDGVANLLSGNSYTAGPITSPCTLQIVCATTMYEVKAAAAPAQGGTVTPASQVTEEGKSATVTAKPNDGYTFDRWDGDCSSANSNLTATLVNVTSNKSCTANFSRILPGVCGSSNGQSFLTSPTANLCQAGNSSSVSQTTSDWTWNCTVSGANAVPCSAKRTLTPVNGACGSAHGQTISTKPYYNLCLPGDTSASSVSDGGTKWTWTCAGNATGTTASCSANKPPACTTPTVLKYMSQDPADGLTYTSGQSITYKVRLRQEFMDRCAATNYYLVAKNGSKDGPEIATSSSRHTVAQGNTDGVVFQITFKLPSKSGRVVFDIYDSNTNQSIGRYQNWSFPYLDFKIK